MRYQDQLARARRLDVRANGGARRCAARGDARGQRAALAQVLGVSPWRRGFF